MAGKPISPNKLLVTLASIQMAVILSLAGATWGNLNNSLAKVEESVAAIQREYAKIALMEYRLQVLQGDVDRLEEKIDRLSGE